MEIFNKLIGSCRSAASCCTVFHCHTSTINYEFAKGVSDLKACLDYCEDQARSCEKLNTLKSRSRLSRLVAHFHISRLFMKGNFDAYVLWPLDKMVQNLIVDQSTACDVTLFVFLPKQNPSTDWEASIVSPTWLFEKVAWFFSKACHSRQIGEQFTTFCWICTIINPHLLNP